MYLEAFEGPSEAAPSKKMKTRQLKIDVIVQNRRGKSGQEMIPFLIFFFVLFLFGMFFGRPKMRRLECVGEFQW